MNDKHKIEVRILTLQFMKPSKYVFESHSSMFVCIAGFEPLCSQISGWIETQENHIFMICLASYSSYSCT